MFRANPQGAHFSRMIASGNKDTKSAYAFFEFVTSERTFEDGQWSNKFETHEAKIFGTKASYMMSKVEDGALKPGGAIEISGSLRNDTRVLKRKGETAKWSDGSEIKVRRDVLYVDEFVLPRDFDFGKKGSATAPAPAAETSEEDAPLTGDPMDDFMGEPDTTIADTDDDDMDLPFN